MKRRTSLLLCGAVAVVTVTLGATTSRASSTGAEAASCPPVSAAQLHAILGLPQSMQEHNTVDDAGDAIRYRCNGAAWSGPPPTTLKGALATARAGHGAAFGIEAWTPNESSPYADQWPKDYEKLTHGFVINVARAPGLFTDAGWPTKVVKPVNFGYVDQAATVVVNVGSGPAKGLVAAVGCWWSDDSYSAVCLLVEESPRRPVVKHLNQLAAITVPKILG
jgi:hypothetical protein